MSSDDHAPRAGFADFDLEGIDQAVAAWQPPERPSQRRAARQLMPLIEHIFAVRPDLPTAQVRKIIEANRRSGPLPNTSTFNRELGAICNEIRSGRASAKQAARPSRARGRAAPRPTAKPVTTSVAQDPGAGGAGEAGSLPKVATVATSTRGSSPAVATAHPLDLFDGKFAGKVYVHTPIIRDFFSAVDKRGDDALLARLARRVSGDAASQACLDNLHPRDRAILEAALSLR